MDEGKGGRDERGQKRQQGYMEASHTGGMGQRTIHRRQSWGTCCVIPPSSLPMLSFPCQPFHLVQNPGYSLLPSNQSQAAEIQKLPSEPTEPSKGILCSSQTYNKLLAFCPGSLYPCFRALYATITQNLQKATKRALCSAAPCPTARLFAPSCLHPHLSAVWEGNCSRDKLTPSGLAFSAGNP